MNIPGGVDFTVGAHRAPTVCATGGTLAFLSPEALTDKARALRLLRHLDTEDLRNLATWCQEEADNRTT
jgi:hypothetical protein